MFSNAIVARSVHCSALLSRLANVDKRLHNCCTILDKTMIKVDQAKNSRSFVQVVGNGKSRMAVTFSSKGRIPSLST